MLPNENRQAGHTGHKSTDFLAMTLDKMTLVLSRYKNQVSKPMVLGGGQVYYENAAYDWLMS